MKRIIFIYVFGLFVTYVNAQVITASPEYPAVNDEITITFDASLCGCSLEGYSGSIYAHTGLITDSSLNNDDWKYVIAEWSENLPKALLSKTGTNTYELSITPDLKTYYGIGDDENVEQLAFVFRSSDGSQQSSNIYYDVYKAGLNISIEEPEGNVILEESDTIDIKFQSVNIGTPVPDSIVLYVDDVVQEISYDDTLVYKLTATGSGIHWIVARAVNSEYDVKDSLFYFVREEITIAALPDTIIDGINYFDTSTVALSLYAPGKESVFVIGDFNDWELDNNYLMKMTPDGKRFWLIIDGLENRKEYIFQYLVDGNLYIADPYTEKISDPQNDEYIPASVYPDMLEYPEGKTREIASVLQTGQTEYEWQVTDFNSPSVQNLVIYELHIRDFVGTHHIKTVTDTLDYLERLGINAIELMPVNEFEGNDSWGYNPSFYFAFDKYYGTKNELKAFIDECHSRGIAVIIDMVLNHSYGQSPLVRLYFNEDEGQWGQVSEDNPWYNVSCPHEPWCWGYDFNHEEQVVKDFTDRVNTFWLTEYKADGFRFDFTKGFTNVESDGWNYDASRIAILKRMYDTIKAVNEDAYVIFEHLTDNTEEKELADSGIMLWGNMNGKYNEATMGYNTSDKSDITRTSYKARLWNMPNLVAYMESHDEERLMFKNLTWGNSSGSYNIKDEVTSLMRIELAATFFFTIPGPKMIWQFGELGFDTSIDDPCRLCAKTPPWDYYEDPRRKRLYDLFATLIDLKRNYDVFSTTDFSMSVTGAAKRINLNDDGMDVTIIGNFDVVEKDIDPQFQHTGQWYSYFTGDTLQVTDINETITLAPGEYRLYTDMKLERPEIGLSANEINYHKGSVKVYPNPASEYVVFECEIDEPGEVQLEVINITGEKVYTEEVNTGDSKNIEIYWDLLGNNLHKIEKGAYIYVLIANKKHFFGKLLVY